jgi:hypothetical protein
MLVLIKEDITISDKTVDGIEFDIWEDKVWIQIKDNYVMVTKEELSKVLKLL